MNCIELSLIQSGSSVLLYKFFCCSFRVKKLWGRLFTPVGKISWRRDVKVERHSQVIESSSLQIWLTFDQLLSIDFAIIHVREPTLRQFRSLSAELMNYAGTVSNFTQVAKLSYMTDSLSGFDHSKTTALSPSNLELNCKMAEKISHIFATKNQHLNSPRFLPIWELELWNSGLDFPHTDIRLG